MKEPVVLTFQFDATAFLGALQVMEQQLERTATRPVEVEGYRRIPLRTGPLRGRRRVDHARLLRMHAWRRRRERRHGIPSGELIWTRTVIPHARVTMQA